MCDPWMTSLLSPPLDLGSCVSGLVIQHCFTLTFGHFPTFSFKFVGIGVVVIVTNGVVFVVVLVVVVVTVSLVTVEGIAQRKAHPESQHFC